MGGMNYHVEICFSDGVAWTARVRRFNATSPPPVLRAPPFHAVNSPIGILLVGEFYDGMNHLGDNEATFARLLEKEGRPDPAGCVGKSRLQHRFNFCRGYDPEDWKGFLGLFQGLRDAVKVDEGLDWDNWKLAALNRYKEDAGLQLSLKQAREPIA